MALLELTCPSCEQVLELDTGFAGGVCRCSVCGQLMTVPDDPALKTRPTQARPERPGQPAPIEDATPTRNVNHTASPGQPLPTLQPRTKPPPRASRRVRSAAIPTHPQTAQPAAARLTTQQRLTVRFAVAAGIAAVIGISVFVMSLFVRHQAQVSDLQRQAPAIEVNFEYDPKANPFTMSRPNVLGIPLSARTVVVIDASFASRRWLGFVKDAVLAGTDFQTDAVGIQFVFARYDSEAVCPDQLMPLSALPRDTMRDTLNGILATGTANIEDAVQLAIAVRPEQLILIIADKPSAEQVVAIRSLLKRASLTRFDAVLVDGETASELLSLATSHDGQYRDLTTQQLGAWRYSKN